MNIEITFFPFRSKLRATVICFMSTSIAYEYYTLQSVPQSQGQLFKSTNPARKTLDIAERGTSGTEGTANGKVHQIS